MGETPKKYKSRVLSVKDLEPKWIEKFSKFERERNFTFPQEFLRLVMGQSAGRRLAKDWEEIFHPAIRAYFPLCQLFPMRQVSDASFELPRAIGTENPRWMAKWILNRMDPNFREGRPLHKQAMLESLCGIAEHIDKEEFAQFRGLVKEYYNSVAEKKEFKELLDELHEETKKDFLKKVKNL